MKNNKKPKWETIQFVNKVDAAMRKMVADVIEEHRRLNMPLVVSRNGKVTYIPADEISSAARDTRGKYVAKKKK